MNFQELKINKHYSTEIDFFTYTNSEGKEFSIEILQYLPVKDKIDLIQTALQKAEENGIYNEIKLDVFFHLNIVYLYTNIEFTDEDREDEFELYDILENEDIINQVVSHMAESEYTNLLNYMTLIKKDSLEYKNTAAAVIRNVITDLPASAAAAKEIVDSFNPEQYQEVINFATAANGGRNINTQTVPINTAAQSEQKQSSPSKVVELKKD